jgi:intracellular sulfur oxidation DsrE/DsrF family protein
MSTHSPSSPERRSFLARLNAGAASLAALAVGGVAMAQEKSAAAARVFEPARHDKDDWLDKLPGKHRLVFDTTTAEGLALAIAFTNNFIRVNRAEYGVANTDLAILIIARHRSTAFGYNDAIWAKYGKALAARDKLEDPKTKAAPTVNIYNTAEFGDLLSNRGTTMDALAKLGVQFGVCSVATRANAGRIAEAVGGSAETINAELISNLVSNARMVPAGIVAVARAQERGYSLVTV